MKTRMYACPKDNCFKSFRSEAAYEEHMNSHENDMKDLPKNFACSKCDRVLATKQSLKEHMFIHFEKKPFRCSEIGCGKMFRQSSQLCNHRKVHKEAKRLMKNQNKKNSKSNFFAQKLSNCSVDDKKVVLPPINISDFDIKLPNILNQN